MFYNNLDPVLVQFGSFSIRYYGIIFAAGILVSFLVLRHLARKRKLPLGGRDFDELLLLSTAAVVVGARLGHVLSHFGYYADFPSQIIAVWNGGMAFHGGFIGLVAAGLYFARRKKIPFYDLADLAVIPAALALGFGRIANFINGEFYGTPTSLPWGVKFGNVEGFRHPVQLYEAAKNFFVFGVLWLLQGRALPKGFLFWLFVFLYGSIRFVLEFLKDDFAVPDYALGMTWGQVWSIPMVLLGGYMLLRLRKGLKAGQGNQQP
ncbi:TPA: prolipoprotein diacylglyceryl transferase [Candidatus Woesearchaeota archaeon]|nr:prolipoprotein diacylglyceryl transferase [Candidatus Woesearchaeota archaeon]